MSIFEIISVIVSLTALIMVIWETIQLRLQLRANFHQEFVRRYTEVIKNMPIKALDDVCLSLKDCIHEKSDFKITLRLYFWIIQEENELHYKNNLPKGQWDIWDAQFRIMMRNRWMQEGWNDLNTKLAFPRKFLHYVESVIADGNRL